MDMSGSLFKLLSWRKEYTLRILKLLLLLTEICLQEEIASFNTAVLQVLFYIGYFPHMPAPSPVCDLQGEKGTCAQKWTNFKRLFERYKNKTKYNINFQTEAGLPFEHRGANIFCSEEPMGIWHAIRTRVPKFVQEVKY